MNSIGLKAEPNLKTNALVNSNLEKNLGIIIVGLTIILCIVAGWFYFCKPSGISQTFNIDFGPGKGNTKQVGPAAVGKDGDFWNSVDTGNNDHTESGLKFADGRPSPIEVESVNLSGGWGNQGKMGVKAPMLDSFNYPVNNRGGDAKVILSHVPPGTYSLYLYGHTDLALQNGDYEVSVAGRDYGHKKTSSGSDAVTNTTWVEASQYVRFPAVRVAAGEKLELLIRPGNRAIVSGGRSVADALICGLQLVKDGQAAELGAN